MRPADKAYLCLHLHQPLLDLLELSHGGGLTQPQGHKILLQLLHFMFARFATRGCLCELAEVSLHFSHLVLQLLQGEIGFGFAQFASNQLLLQSLLLGRWLRLQLAISLKQIQN